MASPDHIQIGNLTGVFKVVSKVFDPFFPNMSPPPSTVNQEKHRESGPWLTIGLGIFVDEQNKDLSDDIAPLLELQNINWLIRKMMATGAPTLDIKEYVDSDGGGKAKLEITLSGPAGIKGLDHKVLDWEPVKKSNGPFGLVENRGRYYSGKVEPVSSPLADEVVEFLNAETLADGSPSAWAGTSADQHLHTAMISEGGGWISEQTWGFEIIDGQRYHTRRGIVSKQGGETRRGRLVYDYVG
ncbi:hypothetical protein PV08_09491 [Exophiala spinifera]|uniref:Uncharacterized protein n=1 Tax=Exophiala spinifera TaxID=91928 RepID=A0A0D2B0G9_9EURO|nr:uncharacterized protein PV08_09491 [Exophiala spinifera]KIW12215.1 hypothetical protein PV08_09491 [Exophiala spinifera]